MTQECIILGIDPGSRITGYGVIKATPKKTLYLASGCIRLKGSQLADRLSQLHEGLQEIILTYQPHEAAVEEVFFYKNPSTALKLGHARGVVLMNILSHKITLAEYSPRQVKQAMVGYGAAEKQQVQKMVQKFLKLSGLPQVDAADALAIAICHANTRKITA